MEIKLDLSKHEAIPKLIHMTWKNKNILSHNSPIVVYGIRNIKKLNPEYELVISEDKDIEKYLKQNLSFFNYLKIKHKKIVEKIDLWRLLKIYNEGGIYIDFDRYCNKSFRDIINPDTKCVLPTFRNLDFSQDIMISCRNNPIYKKAIEYNLSGRSIFNYNNLFHLGPGVYMWAVTETVFGIRLDRNPGEEKIIECRELLEKSTHFQTYKEETRNNFIFKEDNVISIRNQLKDRDLFYQNQGVIHWTKNNNYSHVTFKVFFIIILFKIINNIYSIKKKKIQKKI
tara:strand:+ start:28 stop:879 length:852 start_codon:yes stop_codon:yes gene_type:complete